MLVEVVLVLKVSIVILLLLLPMPGERIVRLSVLVVLGSLPGLSILLLRPWTVQRLVAKYIVLLS